MKKVILGMIATLLFASNIFAHDGDYEAVTIVKAETIFNRMPVIQPGTRKPYSILSVRVMSNGCTKAEDFRVDVDEQAAGPLLSVVRIKPDYCRAVARPIVVDLRVDDTLFRAKPVQVANPLLVETTVVH